MKKTVCLIGFICNVAMAGAQHVNFKRANPQPALEEVYGGDFDSGDVDGDGDIDLILAGITPARRTILYLNDGKGNFTPSEVTTLPQSSDAVTIFRDLDSDGDLDLFLSGIAVGTTGLTQTYMNDGHGVFTPFPVNNLLQCSDSGVGIEDVDGDGDPDILVSVKDVNNVFVSDIFLNDGNGGFDSMGSTDFTPVKFGVVEFIDVEGDGDFDVIISGKLENEMPHTRLYINDGTGNFTADETVDFIQLNADDVDAVDTDNDGDSDVLMSGITAMGEVRTILYLNDGNGGFVELKSADLQQTFAGTNAVADLDNDGDQDFIVIGSQNGGLPNIYNIVYENRGGNQFIPVDTIGGEYIAASQIDDFNGDGRADVIVQGFADKTNVYWNDSPITAVSALEDAPSFVIYPNPSTGTFSVMRDEDMETYDLRVIAIDGRVIVEQLNVSDRTYELDLNVPEGIYQVELRLEHHVYMQQVVINR